MIIIVIIAFILCWIWIEISLIVLNKKLLVNTNDKQASYKKFILILRIFAIILLLITILYMYFFKGIRLQEAIEYCLGVLR